MAVASNRVTPDFPRYCPCCGHGEISTFNQYRTKSHGYLDNLYRLLFNKYGNSLNSSIGDKKKLLIISYLHSFLVEF